MDLDVLSAELAQLGMRQERDGMFVDENEEVAAVVGELGAFVGWLDVSWDGPAMPHVTLRSVTHLPRPCLEPLGNAIADARRERSQALRQCQFCGDWLVPGHMHHINGSDVCHGCAEKSLGLVH
jgi:hypothetical protein